MPPESPQTLSNYRILEKIGGGGMGIVYRAVDTRLRRDVAIKFLSTGSVSRQPHESLLREARLAAALNHPNICTVHEVGEVPEAPTLDLDGLRPAAGTPFLVMELVKGSALNRRAIHAARLEEVLDVADQVAGALAEAHIHGIVHRDLKPGNVMVTDAGRVKILDFGLAKVWVPERADDQVTVTQHGLVAGSPAYMSPEQARGGPVDGRSDIFSFGVMLYELLCGRVPFESDSVPQTLTRILESEPEPLSKLRADLPPELERIVHRCLRKRPERRYNDTRDLVNSIQDLRDSLRTTGGVQAREVVRPELADPRRVEIGRAHVYQRLPGLKAETYAQILAYVLDQQEEGGAWPSQGDHWSEVKTACILKSLARLGFRSGARWEAGGVQRSLDLLTRKLSRLGPREGLVGEDLWDTCQVLLAVAGFGLLESGKQYANEINRAWEDQYREACETVPPVSWTGPSYLAAMGDVLVAYGAVLEDESTLADILKRLRSLERTENGQPTGAYHAANSDDPGRHRWNTALVLRSLAVWPSWDDDMISRSATWILDQLDRANQWLGPTDRESPMYLARCLDGLREAAAHVPGDLVNRIDRALEQGNVRLDALWSPSEKERTGDLKAYSAVVEYLAGWTLNIPAGLAVGPPPAGPVPPAD